MWSTTTVIGAAVKNTWLMSLTERIMIHHYTAYNLSSISHSSCACNVLHLYFDDWAFTTEPVFWEIIHLFSLSFKKHQIYWFLFLICTFCVNTSCQHCLLLTEIDLQVDFQMFVVNLSQSKRPSAQYFWELWKNEVVQIVVGKKKVTSFCCKIASNSNWELTSAEHIPTLLSSFKKL